MSSASLASGTYEVLRTRLRESATELRSRFAKLNAARSAVFGNVETRLMATMHVTTDHNCIPRDIYSTKNRVLLGYNVQFGLKTEITPKDVLSVYRFDGEHAHQESLDSLLSPQFQRDFQELYRYYRNATFSRFLSTGPNLYMVFQIGKTASNIKAFKWVVKDEVLQYIDNRSESEVRQPPQHEFPWKRATRDHHRQGTHPHISIEDQVFVECVNGDLTIKVEDNTEDGLGIYREPVDSPDQTLDDAETFYAILGNLILLKIRPYQERDYRYLVFSTKRSTVERLDSIGQSCVLLPNDHGIIFPNGFVLQTGQSKLFDHKLANLQFDRMIRSPNGEDFLYLFFNQDDGVYLQLRYNLIRQEVDTPLVCHGQAFFENGQMLSMRAGEAAQKHHAIQVWQTPFTGTDFQPTVQSETLLFKIGNRDLVRGMAECQELLTLIDKDESYADLYADLGKRSTNILDAYFWIDREEAFKLSEPIQQIREAANAAIDEFEKVTRVRNETAAALESTEKQTTELLKTVERTRFEKVEDFVQQLAAMRTQRGVAIQLRDLRYIDNDRVTQIETQLVESAQRLGFRCVQFLLEPASLSPYSQRIETVESEVPKVGSSAAAKSLESQLADIGNSLELLVETVSQLHFDDLAQRTTIVDRIGDCLATMNRVRAGLKTRLRSLTTGELESDFASQSKLLDQAAASGLDSATTLDRVDTALTRILIQLEELEGRYAESQELLLRLTEKRQGLCDLFEAKRQQLVEMQSQRANSLVAAANRILEGITSRSSRIDSPTELLAFFASDLMVEKVRKIADQLQELGDSVRRDDVLSRLKSISDDSIRQERDRRELLSDGNRTIRLGQHSFSVNQQPIELTTVLHNDCLNIHLTGTQFFQPLSDPALDAARDLWEQILPSESTRVYRAEYLAYCLFQELTERTAFGRSAFGEVPRMRASEFLALAPAQQTDWVRQQMQTRYAEGYVRGIHDSDGAKILNALLKSQHALGLQAYSPRVRSTSWFVWHFLVPEVNRSPLEHWIRSLAAVDAMFPNDSPNEDCITHVASQLQSKAGALLRGIPIAEGATFLVSALRLDSESMSKGAAGSQRYQASKRSHELFRAMLQHLPQDQWDRLHQTIRSHASHPEQAWTVALQAVDAFLAWHIRHAAQQNQHEPDRDYREELALMLLLPQDTDSVANSPATPSASPSVILTELAGDHPNVANRELVLNYYRFMNRLRKHAKRIVPRWTELQAAKRRLIEQAERRVKSHEFKARVLTTFVRNQLIDEVYLPRIGDNFAKQIGTVGENQRTDRMGLLLLVSPPGYGKTTLMEYIANRLGLVFIKVNGPALGSSVTSLDPSEATNAASRDEVQRINMALEMGDNVMLYLDDIQHCNVELLQKFIPLCDATRRIEGVWNGQSRTYDLRGRKFAVVMAGNPYTETGARFQIPDMLANRADVYNLGEIVGNSKDAFEQSYLENCLTSNPVLQPLARCSNADQRAVLQAAKRGNVEGLELESNLSADSVREMIAVLIKLHRVRDCVLTMNQAYILSAAQADDYRTEPPFKLQGSYRNMNRIAEKVVPVMNDEELQRLILTCYQQDAQTLSRDGESNLLKLRELLGILTDEEAARWASIKKTFVEKNRLRGLSGDDSTAQFLASLLGIHDGLDSIRGALETAASKRQHDDEQPLPEPRVIVQHSVPRVMTELIRSQFQLLYDGLRPVLEGVAQNSATSERLNAAIKDLLARYQAMEAAAKNSAEPPPDEPATY
ncbi:MAG: DNA repair ATPase [Planctomycetota bacterium]